MPLQPISPAPAPALRRPELLAPAGDWECAKAAVENGADAIYFGLDRFNARMRAHNFTAADLPRLMEFLHRRGVRGYVTFNTLVFAHELADAEDYLRSIIAAGVDAAIVQDVGICRLIRRLSADFPIHASTQMTVTSVAGVEFARDLGANLVVLARECSLKEIAKIGGGEVGAVSAMPLEVFVHGALCVAYSGQCLTSESLGGRSANRGECAQACRMPYDLISDGKKIDLGDRRYLLSPQDLAGLEVLPEIIRAGVSSLKIEGRLKAPEYVANITRVYRQAIDRALGIAPSAVPQASPPASSGGASPPTPGRRQLVAAASPSASTRGETPRPLAGGDARDTASPGRRQLVAAASPSASTRGETPRPLAGEDACGTHSAASPDPDRYALEMSFSRGLYPGWFGGINNQQLVHARFGKKRGVYLGRVERIHNGRVALRLEAPAKPGDGVVFDASHPDEKEEGGRLYEVTPEKPRPGAPALTTLAFGHGDIDFSRVHVGDRLWKTSDPELDRRLRASFEGDQPRFQRPVFAEIHGHAGTPLTLILRDEIGHVVQVASAIPLAIAEKQPLTDERLRDQLGRLGGTPFKLDRLANHLEGPVILPMSELNRLRRDAVTQLDALRAQPKRWQLTNLSRALPTLLPALTSAVSAPSAPTESTLPDLPREEAERRALLGMDRPFPFVPSNARRSEDAAKQSPELIVLVRSLPQLEAALRCGVSTLYCELEDPKKYRDAVRMAHESFGCAGPQKTIWVAPPRITKPGEEWILNIVRSSNADGYLIRNYDHLKFFAADRRIGDFSLNIANALSAAHFRERFTLERLTASYDLNIAQLEGLLRTAPPAWFEVTIHQHMPMFHMEHCVFCAFLSTGTDYTNCGRPCDKHDVRLRDRVGAEHPLKADAGCRNTLYNSQAQTGAEFVTTLVAAGLRHFRIEFLNETPDLVAQIIAKYRLLLRGEITGAQLWREFKLMNQLGVTRGQVAG